MPNELPLPEELKHLLEKRTGTDRRESESEVPKQKPPGQSRKPSPKGERRKKGRRKEDTPRRKK